MPEQNPTLFKENKFYKQQNKIHSVQKPTKISRYEKMTKWNKQVHMTYETRINSINQNWCRNGKDDLSADETVKTIINIAQNESENRNVTRRITKDIKNRLTWNKLSV